MSNYTKPTVCRIPITRLEAQQLIIEARVWDQKLDCYQNVSGVLYRVYTVDLPTVYSSDTDVLLQYGRDKMPTTVNF